MSASGCRRLSRVMTCGGRARRLPGLIEQADELLALVGLVGIAASGSRRTLAHGEQRALEIGMALAANPRLLLLDEPTAGMSPEETRVMMDLIVKLAKERTVILVEHKMKLVMGISDRILVLHHGELLAQGTPDRSSPERAGQARLSWPAGALKRCCGRESQRLVRRQPCASGHQPRSEARARSFA